MKSISAKLTLKLYTFFKKPPNVFCPISAFFCLILIIFYPCIFFMCFCVFLLVFNVGVFVVKTTAVIYRQLKVIIKMDCHVRALPRKDGKVSVFASKFRTRNLRGDPWILGDRLLHMSTYSQRRKRGINSFLRSVGHSLWRGK